MQSLTNLTKMCQNNTDIKFGTNQNCSGNTLKFSPTEIAETTAFMEEELAIAEMVFNLRYYIEGVILTPVATIGLFANIISIAVLTSKGMRSCFNTQLAALAVFDLLYLFITILIFGFPMLWDWYKDTIYPVILPVTFGFAHIGRVGSVFATLMVTIERFVAVWCPLSRLKSTKTLLSISIIGSLIYNIPRFLEFQSKTVYVPRHPPSHLEPNQQLQPIPNNSFFNSSKLIDDRTYNSDNFIKRISYEPTELRISPLYIQIYILWMKLLIIEIIPYFVIVILNSCMACRIMKSAKARRIMTNSSVSQNTTDTSRTDVKQAITLMWISVLYVVCQSPKIVPDFYEALYCEYSSDLTCISTPTIEIMISISNLLMVINATSNFFIYMWKGTQFRRVLQRKLYYLYQGRNIDTFRVELYEMSETHRRRQTIRSTELCEV